MRKDIETPLKCKAVAELLMAISRQQPEAEFTVREWKRGFLVDHVHYDGDNNRAVVEIVSNY